VLKTNDALEFAVVTGCLRISRESIFTGLNHLSVVSIRDDDFSEGFGFTEAETEAMLRDYGMEERIPEAKEWYNGYLFGRKEIYNPWSVISYVDAIANKGRLFPEPYWSNTSSNAIVKDLIWHADEERKKELELLIDGGTIEKKIHEDITYGDIHESDENLWNFLFFTGYLKKVSERKDDKYVYVTMKIPNQEIAYIYEDQIRRWFDNTTKKSDRTAFYKAVLDGDTGRLRYEDLALGLGTLPGTELAPAAAPGRLVRAWARDWIASAGDDADSLLAVYEDGPATVRTWFDAEGVPLRAELAQDGRVCFRAEIRNFQWKAGNTNETTQEDLG
jgi:hypothetical protein